MFDGKNGDFDIQQKHINNKGNFVVTAGLSNSGILGKSDVKAKIFSKNTITIDMFGNTFYRNYEYKMVTHARVFSLIPKFIISENIGLFISVSMFYLIHNFGYENMCLWSKIKDNKIKLPIKDENLGAMLENIDFKFMEDFIAELEAQRIAELEAYLIATNLKDYNLTTDEKQALKDFENLEWQEFKTTKIFDIKNTFNILSRDIVKNSGTIPYLCASAENNGVNTYIDYDENFKDKGNCIFIGGKTFVVSYQKTDFFSNDSHNLTLRLKNQIITKENQLFLASCVNKSLSYKYSWGNSVSNSKIKKEFINLPTKNGEINYKFMQNFIKAIEKLVIKDVVDFADKKISLTKKCIKTPCETK